MNNENQHIPTGYKPSPLGIIPEDWEVKRLGEVCDIDKESLSNKTDPNYEFDYISLSDVDSDCFETTTSKQTFRTAPSRARRIVKQGDVIISTVRPNLQAFTLIKDKVNDLIVSTGFAVLTPKQIISEYLFQYVFSHNVSKQFYQLVVGSNYPAVNSSDVSHLKIAVPSINEQQRIIDVLELWDTAIAKQTALIEKLTLRKRGLMQQLLTGKKRLKGFSGEWKRIKFKEIFQRKTQTVNDSSNIQVLSVTKEGIVSQKEYFNKEIASDDTSKYLLVEKGDLAMSGLNFWMGSCHILTQYEKGIISPAYKVFSIRDGFSIEYIVNFVQSHNFKSSLLGSSVIGASIVRRNLDLEMLEEWIYLLPSLPEQKAISDILTYADKEIEIQKQKLAAMQEQKKGLMQVLLTGRKRVRADRRVCP